MKSNSKIIGTIVAGLVRIGAATTTTCSVTGTAEGFAKGVTGGGDATPVVPADYKELITLLESDEPAVICLDKTYSFLGTEGTKTETGCAPYTTAAGCQQAINAINWCSSSYPSVEVTYDEAAMEGINIGSNKSIIGVGDAGVMIGKGLRMVGSKNIIIQNIMITDLNPKYVWGGDAVTIVGSDQIWVDHVTTQYLGRQHYVFGFDTSTRVTLSNNFINGNTNYSQGCDGYHYWTVEMVGTADQITMKNNYIYHTSGRAPALSGGTFLHAINNVWDGNTGHAIEGDKWGSGLFEGNVFTDIDTVIVDDFAGQIFDASADNASKCQSALGRSCFANTLSGSGAFTGSDTAFFSNFTGLSIAAAEAAADIADTVPANAGMGKLSSSSSSGSAAVATASSKASSATQAATKTASSTTKKAAASSTSTKKTASSTTSKTSAKTTAAKAAVAAKNVASSSGGSTATSAPVATGAASTAKASCKNSKRKAEARAARRQASL